MSIQKPQKKLYYSLRQTAQMTGLTTTALKSWEKEYPVLQPMRNRAGNRYYTEKDITLLFIIRDLMVEKKWPSEKILAYLKNQTGESLDSEGKKFQFKKVLAEIKMEITEILAILNEPVK